MRKYHDVRHFETHKQTNKENWLDSVTGIQHVAEDEKCRNEDKQQNTYYSLRQ